MKSLTDFITEQLENPKENPIQENTQSTVNPKQVAENSNNQEAVQEGENTGSTE